MSWFHAFDRFRPRPRRVRRAILKGGGELENVGDVMMRRVAEPLITSMGFEIAHRVGHGEITDDVARSAGTIDAIFVLGSIQYSDAWATPTLLERLERSLRFHKRFPDARVVFLPATWGAFGGEHRHALSALVNGATVLVRDTFSAEDINALLERPVAEYCPDLAFLYPQSTPDAARPFLDRLFGDASKPLLGIVPNHRCVEPGVTPLDRPADYIDALARIRDSAVDQGFNVVGISHMVDTDRDLALIRELDIPCIPATDVTTIRSAIASLDACVCSRYHGVISCLSHGTPVLALGWHHKYRNVMNDMALGEFHLPLTAPRGETAAVFQRLIDNRDALRRVVTTNVAAARNLVRTRTAALTASAGSMSL